jgi:hypothetical protein
MLTLGIHTCNNNSGFSKSCGTYKKCNYFRTVSFKNVLSEELVLWSIEVLYSYLCAYLCIKRVYKYCTYNRRHCVDIYMCYLPIHVYSSFPNFHEW